MYLTIVMVLRSACSPKFRNKDDDLKYLPSYWTLKGPMPRLLVQSSKKDF